MSLKRLTTPIVSTKAKAGDVTPETECDRDMRPPRHLGTPGLATPNARRRCPRKGRGPRMEEGDETVPGKSPYREQRQGNWTSWQVVGPRYPRQSRAYSGRGRFQEAQRQRRRALSEALGRPQPAAQSQSIPLGAVDADVL